MHFFIKEKVKVKFEMNKVKVRFEVNKVNVKFEMNKVKVRFEVNKVFSELKCISHVTRIFVPKKRISVFNYVRFKS